MRAKKRKIAAARPGEGCAEQKSDFPMGRRAISRLRHFFPKKTGGELFPCVGDAGPR